MSKKIVFTSLAVLYVLGILSSIIVLTNTESKTTKISTKITDLTNFSKPANEDQIGVISINGPIFFGNPSDDSVFSALNKPQGAGYWIQQLNEAATNANIKAVILRMNTPGGTVAASQELHAAVGRVQKAGKPVIASVADMSASGGYYMTAGVDRMFVNRGSIVGSIGVIMSSLEYSGLFKKIGVVANVITSGPAKDTLSPYRKLTPEEQARLQMNVNDMYEDFLKVVIRGRKSTDAKMRPLADGGIYTGNQAVKLGLADQIGTYQTALEYVKKKYELEDAKVTAITLPEQGFDLKQLFTSFLGYKSPEINVNLGQQMSNSPFLYLYQF